ncbi:MAG: GNAT family N-acetyltransferase [Bacteroidales bacterium]|nr:GNAT family N-acetyltransferase [Bacteroidales bacterium]
MFIKNDTIALRCAEPEDAKQIYAWENDRDIWRVSGTHAPYSRFQIEQFLLSDNDLAANKQLRLMIDLTETGQSIGCIDIFDYDALNSRAGLGILIDKAFRRQGYAKAALALCVEYLFHDLMLHQVYCSIDETNTESQQLFLSQGFALCGRRKGWIKTPEGFIDELEYQKMNKKVVILLVL